MDNENPNKQSVKKHLSMASYTKSLSNQEDATSSIDCEDSSLNIERVHWKKARKLNWDRKTPFYSLSLELFFDSLPDFIEELKTQGIYDPAPSPETYLIYATERKPLITVDSELLIDGCIEDFDPDDFIPYEVLTKLHELNDEIKRHRSKGYQVTDTAIDCF